MSYLIPGELIPEEGFIELNKGREITTIKVSNVSDRPIQIGSHYHFFESNQGLIFDRQSSLGKRLDIPAGTAIRFEPGDQREVNLVPYSGDRKIFGFNGLINASLKK
ncbi:urease subunit beta [Prochlorococcus marinus]|uniref:Urease subunit beta n=1 Tax=Prochlorococcus marinus XMU1408 TaxID=2213228 RepID=A0A318R1Q1_PROMR|nr:urease subunit beta [Prochlorococcus marinus]MBW3042701.1 urease subunit beta [Prochlorococcus marinus str. XMU1408]PYE01393.1 urease subunit beta [Prochlorococcus marinus XMU1408]